MPQRTSMRMNIKTFNTSWSLGILSWCLREEMTQWGILLVRCHYFGGMQLWVQARGNMEFTYESAKAFYPYKSWIGEASHARSTSARVSSKLVSYLNLLIYPGVTKKELWDIDILLQGGNRIIEITHLFSWLYETQVPHGIRPSWDMTSLKMFKGWGIRPWSLTKRNYNH